MFNRISTFVVISLLLHTSILMYVVTTPVSGKRWQNMPSFDVSIYTHQPSSSTKNIHGSQKANKANKAIHNINAKTYTKQSPVTLSKQNVSNKNNKTETTNKSSIKELNSDFIQKKSNSIGSLLKNGLMKELTANFTYPSIARRNNWEGDVKVSLRIESDGCITKIQLLKTSGYPVLDHSAINNLNTVSYIKDAVKWLNGKHFDMILPIEYRLVDS